MMALKHNTGLKIILSANLIIWSYIIVALVMVCSLLGILDPAVYQQETPAWTTQGIGQDIGSLFAVIVFVLALFFRKKVPFTSYAIWTGTLLYFIYAYLLYAFCIHFNYLFLAYVGTLAISFYALLISITKQNWKDIEAEIKPQHVRIPAILLVSIGVLFGILWLTDIVQALWYGIKPKGLVETGLWTNPVHVIDLAFVLPGMISSGILLYQRNFIGIITASTWLTFAILMGLSIEVTLLLDYVHGNKEAVIPMLFLAVIPIGSVVVLYRFLLSLTKSKVS